MLMGHKSTEIFTKQLRTGVSSNRLLMMKQFSLGCKSHFPSGAEALTLKMRLHDSFTASFLQVTVNVCFQPTEAGYLEFYTVSSHLWHGHCS